MTLSDGQLDRYARHIILKEIGGAGQKALLEAHVAVIGAGGVGSPLIPYLAGVGIGRLRVIDDDRVSIENLHRQILFDTGDVGRSKIDAVGERMAALNAEVAFTGIGERLDRGNAPKLLEGVDLVVDGSDNFATRLAVSDHCTAHHIPLVSAAIGQFQAQVGTFRGWEPGKPCYRCFVGDAFDSEHCDTCSEHGVLGPMVGIAGSFAGLEVIREITSFGEDAVGKLHIFDGLKPAMRTIRITKDPACAGCGSSGADQP